MTVEEFINNHMKRIGYVVRDANVINLKQKYRKRILEHEEEFTDEEAEFFLYNSDKIAKQTLLRIKSYVK